MSIIKRLSATLVSGIDKVVGEIENHEAVVYASLDEMRKKLAEAKVRLGQIHREQAGLGRKIAEHQQKQHLWRRRAVECATGGDEVKALECMRRAGDCQRQVDRLEQARIRYREASEKLQRDIDGGEQRLAELKQKYILMRARQSTAAALDAAGDSDDDITRLLDGTFERWEITLCQAETVLADHDDVDEIERVFLDQEQQHALRSELASLLAEEEKK